MNLRDLDLSYNPIGTAGAEHLAALFRGQLQVDAESAEDHSAFLEGQDSVDILNFSHDAPVLTTLDLEKCHIDSAFTALAKVEYATHAQPSSAIFQSK